MGTAGIARRLRPGLTAGTASVRNGVGLPQKEQKVNYMAGNAIVSAAKARNPGRRGEIRRLLRLVGRRRNATPRDGGIGSTTGAGICHAYTPDGRCVSLLKILLTNFCIYDCAYCVSRRSAMSPRARFTVDEVVTSRSTSTAATASKDCFCRPASRAARTTRWRTWCGSRNAAQRARLPRLYPSEDHSRARAPSDRGSGPYADRLSMNVDLPTRRRLKAFAPEKNVTSIKQGLRNARQDREREAHAARSRHDWTRRAAALRAGRTIDPVIVGADAHRRHRDPQRQRVALRVLSAQARVLLGLQPDRPSIRAAAAFATPLLREHRLYQADWLLRFYGFLCDLSAAAPPACSISDRSQARLGAESIARDFRSM